MAFQILGIIGWAIFTVPAFVCVSMPEYQVFAIISAIAGLGFGIMMQLTAIVDQMKN